MSKKRATKPKPDARARLIARCERSVRKYQVQLGELDRRRRELRVPIERKLAEAMEILHALGRRVGEITPDTDEPEHLETGL